MPAALNEMADRRSAAADFCNKICHERKLVIRGKDLTDLPPLDGVASLHFVECKLRVHTPPQ
jgi:hypothetical protein